MSDRAAPRPAFRTAMDLLGAYVASNDRVGRRRTGARRPGRIAPRPRHFCIVLAPMAAWRSATCDPPRRRSGARALGDDIPTSDDASPVGRSKLPLPPSCPAAAPAPAVYPAQPSVEVSYDFSYSLQLPVTKVGEIALAAGSGILALCRGLHARTALRMRRARPFRTSLRAKRARRCDGSEAAPAQFFHVADSSSFARLIIRSFAPRASADQPGARRARVVPLDAGPPARRDRTARAGHARRCSVAAAAAAKVRNLHSLPCLPACPSAGDRDGARRVPANSAHSVAHRQGRGGKDQRQCVVE